jgi:hypothetical protein
VSDCTGDLTLFAADATLGMDKDIFHIQPTSFVFASFSNEKTIVFK